MGRADKVGMQIGIGLLDIIAVLTDGVRETSDVVVGVIADAMTLVNDTLMELGILTRIVAHHKEGSLDAIALQHIEYPGRRLRNRPVVEGQIDGLLVTVHTP